MSNIAVSILMPIKNEAKNIKNCLQQILNQTYDLSKLEVLVIDGNSEDNTLKLIEEFKTTSTNLKIKVLQDTKQQRSSGLNEGIKHATGDLILRIDARAVIAEDYIARCVKTLLDTGADNVGGIQKPLAIEMNPTQLAIGYAMSHPFGVGNAQFRLGKKSGPVDSVYLGCFRRELFAKIGLFDDESPIISEDSDINYRIRRHGGTVYLDKDILAYYIPREQLSGLARLYFRYGGARAGFMLKWKTYTGSRQLIPPLFVATILLLPLLFVFSPLWFYLWFFLLISYFCGDLLASLSVVKKTKQWSLLLRLLLIFPTMHFSWALGLWKRLLQGKNCNYWSY